jgi:protein-S-isoprenylcysteine O-methyltransferase Ste14
LSRIPVNRKVRLRIGFLFAIAYLAFARPTPGSLLLGLPVAFVGLLIRAWAAGHIVKDEKLTTTGPYAHTRNPLYFGSFMIAAGFALAAHWSLLLVVIALFAFIYSPTIEQERAEIRRRFPEAYPHYEANVPRLRRGLHRGAGKPAANRLVSTGTCVRESGRPPLAFVAVSAWLIARSTFGF